VGIVAPAAAVEIEAVRRGQYALEEMGFRTRVGEGVFSRHRYLAGPDARRVAELQAMFQDPEVKGIICARAGYGSGRLLPLLDFSTLRCVPKIFIGYSDATLLLNALVQRAGFVSFHGPVVAGEFANGLSVRARDHLLRLVTGGKGEAELTFSHVLRRGTGEGLLLGGCLSVLVTTLGTPFDLDTTEAVLFLEDVGEKPYRIDRMLTHLKQAGKLAHLRGVVFGQMAGCLGEGNDPQELLDIIAETFAEYDYPVGFGLPAGHGSENLTLPLGTRVRLDGHRRCLVFLESAVE
jgi:muramoyltetrapeptide carboxypeptidase